MKILAVGAHLDDIEIACGGTLAKAIENGHDVKVLIMSRSGYTNKEGKVQRSDETAVEAFSLSSFTFTKRLFNSSSLSAIRVVSSPSLRLLIFLPAILIPACASSSPAFLMIYSVFTG